jgi:hypothetical protein
MPQETKSTAPVEMPQPVAGLVVDHSDEAALRKAIDMAFDYRGDVTVTRRDGTAIVGFIFDRRLLPRLGECVIRVIPADGSPRVSLRGDEIASIAFTGRDTASGKSFETWMKKYVQKKLAGESASIESESLGD